MTRITPAEARRLLGGLLDQESPAPMALQRAVRAREASKAPTLPDNYPIIVTVPALPPTVNHLYVTARGGRRVLTEAARAWYDLAIPAIAAQARGYTVPAGPLRLSIVLYHLSRSRDLDNALKASQDAIAKALGFDDKRIDLLTVARGVGKPARTVYTLEAL